MRMSGTEARRLLAPWVHDRRRVWCMFGAPDLGGARLGVLWSLDEDLLTIRQSNGAAERWVELHIPVADVEIEYFEPSQAPVEMTPTQPLAWFDAAFYVHQPELSEAGAAIELRWALWITNPTQERRHASASGQA